MNARSQSELPDLVSFFQQIDLAYWIAGEAPNDTQIDALASQCYSAVSVLRQRGEFNSTHLFIFIPVLSGFISSDYTQQVAEDLFLLFQDGRKETVKERGMVGIAHAIVETNLTHNFDVNAFKSRVIDVYQKFYNPETEQDKYNAPYFVFVQSSGMGKTKILYEYKKWLNENSSKESCMLVLCRTVNEEKEKEVYDKFLDIQSWNDGKTSFPDIVSNVFAKMDELLNGVKEKVVVILFDEAHYLLQAGHYKDGAVNEENTNNKKMEAMLFRIVRLWLCRKRIDQKCIVAVFTGTTAALTNFNITDDLIKELQTDTRKYHSDNNEDFYGRGSSFFQPFFTTTTIGCLRFRKNAAGSNETETDYDRAVPYGRPLFAVMTPDERQEALGEIASRLVGDLNNWHSKESAWLSVLGTRVQMGQTNYEIASKLVSLSYANLVDVTGNSAQICFLPDPVCAHLAMCLMDISWNYQTVGLSGMRKTWWAERMEYLYSRQICKPEKGDFGEVMVALYFLLCADTLRREIDTEYKTFSVPLDQWIQCLTRGGKLQQDAGASSMSAGETSNKKAKTAKCQLSFGAIQVCRNYVRAYDESWESLGRERFLRNLYMSGVGFYVFAGCSTIDEVFPLQLKVGNNLRYLPLFVSIKSHLYFSPESAKRECLAMKEKADKVREKTSLGVLCILVVWGSDRTSNDNEYSLTAGCVEKLARNEVVTAVLRVPTDDVFGLSQAYLRASSQREISEVIASHSFLGAHLEAETDETKKKEFCSRILRLRPKKKSNDGTTVRTTDKITETTDDLVKDLENIVPSGQMDTEDIPGSSVQDSDKVDDSMEEG